MKRALGFRVEVLNAPVTQSQAEASFQRDILPDLLRGRPSVEPGGSLVMKCGPRGRDEVWYRVRVTDISGLFIAEG